MEKDWIGGNAAVFNPDPKHYTRKQHSWKAKEAYDIMIMLGSS